MSKGKTTQGIYLQVSGWNSLCFWQQVSRLSLHSKQLQFLGCWIRSLGHGVLQTHSQRSSSNVMCGPQRAGSWRWGWSKEEQKHIGQIVVAWIIGSPKLIVYFTSSMSNLDSPNLLPIDLYPYFFYKVRKISLWFHNTNTGLCVFLDLWFLKYHKLNVFDKIFLEISMLMTCLKCKLPQPSISNKI